MTEPDDAENVRMSPDDRGWMVDTLLALLQTPSPSGRTDAVMLSPGSGPAAPKNNPAAESKILAAGWDLQDICQLWAQGRSSVRPVTGS